MEFALHVNALDELVDRLSSSRMNCPDHLVAPWLHRPVYGPADRIQITTPAHASPPRQRSRTCSRSLMWQKNVQAGRAHRAIDPTLNGIMPDHGMTLVRPTSRWATCTSLLDSVETTPFTRFVPPSTNCPNRSVLCTILVMAVTSARTPHGSLARFQRLRTSESNNAPSQILIARGQ